MSESAHRIMMNIFLLTPLREGRRHTPPDIDNNVSISTHAPAGGATITMYGDIYEQQPFLLTPLREGRRDKWLQNDQRNIYFYSRPCGRGDATNGSTTISGTSISTHAPAGGATSGGPEHGKG